jgi:hypothetical protein
MSFFQAEMTRKLPFRYHNIDINVNGLQGIDLMKVFRLLRKP